MHFSIDQKVTYRSSGLVDAPPFAGSNSYFRLSDAQGKAIINQGFIDWDYATLASTGTLDPGEYSILAVAETRLEEGYSGGGAMFDFDFSIEDLVPAEPTTWSSIKARPW